MELFLWLLAESVVSCLPVLGYFVLWGCGWFRPLKAKDVPVTSSVPIAAEAIGMFFGLVFHVVAATPLDQPADVRPGYAPLLVFLPTTLGWMEFVNSHLGWPLLSRDSSSHDATLSPPQLAGAAWAFRKDSKSARWSLGLGDRAGTAAFLVAAALFYLFRELQQLCGESSKIRPMTLGLWAGGSHLVLWLGRVIARRLGAPLGLRFWMSGLVLQGLVVTLVYWGRPELVAVLLAASLPIVIRMLFAVPDPWEQAEAGELARTRLASLRSQLQPHFLFNTLHTIGVTAKHDPSAAQRMTTLLGDLLRASLTDRGGSLVSLSEELTLLQPYVQLQQVRFQDRLRIETDVPPRLLAAQVPDLLLQPLVENAIEHGIEQRPGAGLVRIVARTEDGKLVVEVEDDGPGPEQEGEPKDVGTGLGATIQRIRLLFAAEAWLELRRNRHGGTTVQVRLPLEFAQGGA